MRFHICDADQSWQSVFVGGAIFGDVGGLSFAISWLDHDRIMFELSAIGISLLVARAIVGDVGVSLGVAFADVGMSLFVAGALFGDVGKISWHHMTWRYITSHHITWHDISQLAALPYLMSRHNQPHYCISPRSQPHNITYHITAHYIANTDTPQKHNQPPPDRTAEGWCTQTPRFGHRASRWLSALRNIL